MSGDVIVNLGSGQEFRYSIAPAGDLSAAKVWLDEQFLAFDCEPLRASGKVLVADKLLAIAGAAGPAELGNEAWGPRFAAAVLAATGRPLVRIDVPSGTVTY